jgi:hypothetical protein
MDILNSGSPARLAKLRREATRLGNGKTWRNARYSRFSDPYPDACHGWNERRGRRVPIIFAFDRLDLPVRGIQYSDEITRIDHRGWYASDDGSRGVVRGFVASLPHGRYLPGYHCTDNDEFVIFTGSVFDDAKECARDADTEAEWYAETLRDDDERFRRMVDAESMIESRESDIRAAWEDYRAAWSGFLEDPRHATAARRAREWVRELLQNLRDDRREYADARAAYERG